MFESEEFAVQQNFLRTFSDETRLFTDLLNLYEVTLTSLAGGTHTNTDYAVIALASLNLKSFNSTFDRLSKGYINDSEAILKKAIETFIAEAYFHEHTAHAERYMNGESINQITNRGNMVDDLDRIQATRQIFPTDYPNFFREYIYDVGYGNSNSVAHLDFDHVHRELGLEDDPTRWATTMVIGPRYHEAYMRIVLNRLVMFCSFQISYIIETYHLQRTEEYTRVFSEVRRLFMEN